MQTKTKITIGMLSYLIIGLVMGKISEVSQAVYFLVVLLPALAILGSIYVWIYYHLEGISPPKAEAKGIRNVESS